MSRDPQTPDEWQEAVNAAEACLLLESARMYGLVGGGPEIDVPRCEEILTRARAQRVMPTEAGIERAIREMWRQRVTPAEAEAAIDEMSGRR